MKKKFLVPSLTVNESPFLPMVHGKATDAIANMAGGDFTKDTLANTASIDINEVKLVLKNVNNLAGTLGVSTHKLLSKGITTFTALNHTGDKSQTLKSLKVTIPLKEYAFLCGYDVLEHETATPEEAEKEQLRAKRALDNFRRKVTKDLDVLYNASMTWSEKVKDGKKYATKDFLDVRILSGKGVRNGLIYMEFPQSMGEYLVKLPITQYATALYGLDERNSNAYAMGLKMTEHYNMDNNQLKGTAQLLKVGTLLKVTSLPSIDSPSVKKNSWELRIKEPFENALDALTACGLLEDWEYSKPKGESMTDEEATTFSDFYDWENTLVHFTLANAVSHTARLEAKAEKKKEARAKRKKSK